MILDSLDDCIEEGSRRAPRCQFEIPGVAQKVVIAFDGLGCIGEGPRCASM